MQGWLFLVILQVGTGKFGVTARMVPTFNLDVDITAAEPAPVLPVLPVLDGLAFPPYIKVFQNGECTRNDGRARPVPGGAGTTLIDTDKICFSCFRVPTILAGQTPGMIHAFAEARRGELNSGENSSMSGAGGCPDGPDTRLVYKRSTDYGATWGSLTVFLQNPRARAENGLCQSQAAPVIDPVTKTLIVGFIANGPGCQTTGAYLAKPALVRSTDDGLTWSQPYDLMLNMGPDKPTVPAGPRNITAGVFGPTKGLTIQRPDGSVRLQLPGEADWSASVFSDDHGHSWQSNALNRSYTLSPGEMDWTICSKGTACPPGMKFIMVSRATGRACPTMCVQFSADGVVWGPQIATVNSDNLNVGQGHAKPGIVAVPGAFISSQTLLLCPSGVRMNSDFSCGTPSSPSYRKREPSDVLGNGMCLMISRDGVHWSLFKKTWPIGGMYTTVAGLSFDADGAALRYGVIFAGGSLPWDRSGHIYYMNFTAVHANGTMDAELARAIAKL